MTAPRLAVARASAAPARPFPTRPGPVRIAPAPERRPDLRIVRPPRPRRGRAVVVAVLVVACTSLLGTATLHTMLVSGQRQVDHLEEQVRATEQANQARRLEVAELESPVRIVEEAERDGMVEPDEVTWLTPAPDGTVASSRASRSGAEPPTGG